MGEFLNDKQLITGDNHQLMFLRNKLPVLTCQPHVVGSTTFWLNSTIKSVQSLSAKTGMVYAADYSIWHQRMGHPGDDILWKLPEIVKGAPKLITIPTAKKPCEACVKGKMPSCSFPPSVLRAMKPFQIVHLDLKDMIKRSFNGYHYILTVLDDFMSHTWSFNLKKKSDTLSMLGSLLPMPKINTMPPSALGDLMVGLNSSTMHLKLCYAIMVSYLRPVCLTSTNKMVMLND